MSQDRFNNNKNIPNCIRKKANGLSFIEFVFIIFAIMYYWLPIVSTRIPHTVFFAVCSFYMMHLVLKNIEAKYILSIFLIAITISLLYFFLTNTQTVSSLVSNYNLKRIYSKLFQVVLNFFPVILFIRVIKCSTQKQIKILLLIIVLIFVYTTIITFNELTINEYVTRDWAQFDALSAINVGTYAYVYATAIIVIVLTALYRRFSQSLIKLLLIIGIVFLLVFLVFAQYTLALLIAIIGIICQIAIEQTFQKKIIFIVLSTLSLFILPFALDYLASVIPAEKVATRLKDISNFFLSGDASGQNLSGRLNLYQQTIETFINSPIIGNRVLNFDGHATFLTVFADIGIFGGALFVFLYVLAKKHIVNNISSNNKKIFETIVFCLVLMGLTNPIHSAPPLSFAIWFVVPLVLQLFNKGEDTQ